MQTFEAFENYKYLTGEQVQLTLKDTYMSHPSGRLIGGLICMTNFRIIFVPSDESVGQAKESGFIVPDCWLQIPLSCIEKLEKEKKQHWQAFQRLCSDVDLVAWVLHAARF